MIHSASIRWRRPVVTAFLFARRRNESSPKLRTETEDGKTRNEEEDERHRDVQWKKSAFKPKRDGTFNLHDSSPHLDRNRHVVQNMRQNSRFRRLDSTFECQCQAMG